MSSFNKVLLLGNLTRDPELRITPKGTSICQFGVAVNRQWKDESGANREETTFVDCEAWGRQGENVSKYLEKGSPIFLEGRLKFEQWDDKQSGQKRSKMKVIAESVQFIGGAKKQGSGNPSGYQEQDNPTYSATPPRVNQPAGSQGNGQEHVDDDVSF